MASIDNQENISKWLGLVVNEVNEDDLLRVAQGDITWRTLPVRLVKFPVDTSQVAILSWRWDTEEQTQPSRNLLSAIRQAKQIGIQYLFIDVISIDQQLDGDRLLEQVVAFSTLYRSLPVIVAYDKVGEDILKTMRRPWIFKEIRAFQQNPTKVIYVGYNGQAKQFEYMLSRIGESLTPTIIGVLCGTIGMHSVSDFKFIIPAFAQIFTIAYRQMSKNDYLLTVAILCQVYAPDYANGYNDIEPLVFNRYSLKEYNGNSEWSSSWTICDIFLDETKIAIWRHKENEYINTTQSHLDVLPLAERIIFTALRQAESDYRVYTAQEGTRRASFHMTHGGAGPEIKVVNVSL